MVNKSSAIHIKLIALNSRYIHSSLALFYIRNSLRKYIPAAEIEIIQATINDNYYETLLNITKGAPEAVFLSANIWNSNRIETLAHDIKECLPHCSVVIGGPQADAASKQLPPNLCTFVIGEIEAVEPQFYQDLTAGKLAGRYEGSFLKKNIGELDYPFIDEDFDYHLKNRHIYYETSRGCPFSCSYCLSAAEKGLFHKGVEQVEAELLKLLSFKPKVIRFVDRTFNDNPKRAHRIWEFLLNQQGDTLFHFEIAPDKFTDQTLELLASAPIGRFQFEIGVQSTNEKTLTAIRRHTNNSQVMDTISKLAAFNNIHLHVDLILGLPYETKSTFAQSFRDLFAAQAHYIQMGLLKILPDTPLYYEAEEHGYRYSISPPYAVFSNNWLSHEEMTALYFFSEGVEKFYNNRYFVNLWKYLRRAGEDAFQFFEGLLICAEDHDLFDRAPTQELLTAILMDFCSSREDARIIMHILRFDWLRCGFRKLPVSLMFDEVEEQSEQTRDMLYKGLPETLTGVFTSREKNKFFKSSVFLCVSQEAAAELDLIDKSSADVRIALLCDREVSLYKHNRVVVFDQFISSVS